MAGEKMGVQFDSRGLAPAVVQDDSTDQVLMVAWMNEEALQRTLESGQAHFWSRSRQELWHKGATSGNFMHVRDILVDCDADTLLLKVDPQGPACHTGERSCFCRHWPSVPNADRARAEGQGIGRTLPAARPPSESGIVRELFSVILDRQASRPQDSYTARLFAAGEDEILKKVGEEAVEVVLAAKGQGDDRLVSEIADLTYHLLVLLAARRLDPADVRTELKKRRR